MHFLYFSGGGFCFSLALLHACIPMKRAWVWGLYGAVFGMVIGATDEYHQSFTPGRSGNDVGDWLADLSGASAGALLAWAVVRLVRRHHFAKAG
jgi:VanZ family protein